MTQEESLDIMKLGHNVYLTGRAGSGKTYVLNKFIAYLRSHHIEIGVTASTGIAATHMNGVTIHSWSGLGIRDALSPYDLEAMEEKSYLWRRFENTKVLIIDEVSMLHHFRLDLIEQICRFFKRNEAPFGGLQVIMCGDFFQLPPVARHGEPDPLFIYHSDAWKNMDLKICYLEEQHRQTDKHFLNILNEIRGNTFSDESRKLLTSRFDKDAHGRIRPTKLYTHNVDVDALNEAELHKIEGEIHEFTMSQSGKDFIADALKKTCLAPEKLRLKKGAEVMFVKNNYEVGYANGTLGTVLAFDESGFPIVETVHKKRITAAPTTWHVENEGKVLAEISQIPLRLAWAITVHKSQGMSLDAVEIDLSKSFVAGMGYVALSRVRTLQGLKLMGLNELALRVNSEILEYDAELHERSEKTRAQLAKIPKGEVAALQRKYIESIAGKRVKTTKLPTHLVTKTLLDEKKSLKDIAEIRKLTVDTILDHIDKIQTEKIPTNIEYLKYDALSVSRFKKIEMAFKKCAEKNSEYRLLPVKNALGKSYTYNEIKLVKLFMREE